MLLNRSIFPLCAGLLIASACTHDAKRAESQASATQERPALQEDRRVAATDPVMEPRVEDQAASHGQHGSQHDHGHHGQSASNARTEPATAGGASGEADACELAVYFQTDSARLDADSRERLNTVAECMKRRAIDHATIVGQTDPSGTPEHNQKLGLERAKAVADYLQNRGVPADQIRVQSKGEMASAGQSQQLWPVERRAGIDAKK